MEWNTAPRRIFASSILCHALVRPRVFLLEIRDFKDGVWILHLDFAGERDAAGSPPAYFWDGATKEEQKVPTMATVSRCDQSVIKHKTKKLLMQKPGELFLPTNHTAIAQTSDALKKNFDFCSLVFPCSRMDWWIREWVMLRFCILKSSWVALIHAWMSLQIMSHAHNSGWLTFPERSIPVSLPIPSQLELSQENELLF